MRCCLMVLGYAIAAVLLIVAGPAAGLNVRAFASTIDLA